MAACTQNKSFSGLFYLTLLPMVVLFVSVPRRSAPFLGVPQTSSTQATTGMSDTMKPGSIGDLVLSNEPVFTATFDNGVIPQQQNLYWRVMVMGQHNGNEWQAMHDFVDRADASKGQHIAYSIITEDDKGRIPALDYPQVRNRRGGVYGIGQCVAHIQPQRCTPR